MTVTNKKWFKWSFSNKRIDSLVITILVMTNLIAWAFLINSKKPVHTVDGIRDDEVVELLELIGSGDHSGEEWTVTLNKKEAEQTITWYLERYPQIPFAHPEIEITPDYIEGQGDAVIAGFQVHVGGKARIELQDGLPIVQILELSIPIPKSMRDALENEITHQLKRANELPVRFTSAEWKDGEVVVKGYVR